MILDTTSKFAHAQMPTEQGLYAWNVYPTLIT